MSGVLDGIRVVDFSRVFAGPCATQVLGDLGAEVIKIEEPGSGDSSRHFAGQPETQARLHDASPSYLAFNRNKRSIVLDFQSPGGHEVVLRLLDRADVILHNMRPGVMKRRGLDYDTIKARNPRIIYCEFSAYGQTGPMAHFGANDVALQAHSGLVSITGSEGGEGVRSGTSVVDIHGGMAAASAILAALLHRERTGEGQYVETSLLRSSAHLMNYFYTEYWLDGSMPPRLGTANLLSVPNQAFPASDGNVIIIAGSDDMWSRCARALDADKVDLPQFRNFLDRRANRVELVRVVSSVTSTMNCAEIIARLSKAMVNVSKVNSVGEAADDPQLAAIGGITEFEYNGVSAKSVTTPFTMSKTPVRLNGAPPMLGADTDAILSELGYGAEDISAMKQAGSVGATAVHRRKSSPA